ncbi:MAG: hypothetical protein MZV63_48370 [Marinilabiliales bacterium]|nr:hypothetical protein [Marinilabiliales bacterium]
MPEDLRYHGAGVLVSQLLQGRICRSKSQACSENALKEVFSSPGRKGSFLHLSRHMPSPVLLMRQGGLILKECQEAILFNLSGHGHFDISAYEKFFEGNLPDHETTAEEIEKSLS